MPHDKDGNLIHIGDRVSVEYEVTGVTADEKYCNLSLRTVLLMPPYTDEASGRSYANLNSRQVALLPSVGATRPD